MIRLSVLIFLLVPQLSWGQSSLPPCPETGVRHNCFGSLVNATGGKYVGEYQNGLRHGNGVYYYGDGTILLSGRWMDDVLKQNYKLDAAMFPFDLQNSGPTQGASAGVGGQGNFLDAGYLMRLRKAIRDNTVFNEAVRGNPRAEFTVNLSGSCEVLQVRLKSSSGNRSWDERAERAISRTTPFPKPPSGTCPSSILISHQPYERANSDQAQASSEKESLEEKKLAERINRSAEEQKLAERLRADQIARMNNTNTPPGDERNKITAELEAERKKRQELELQLAEAKEREKQLAEAKEREGQQAQAPQPQRPQAVLRNERRLALIIGNSSYKVSPLDNPANDATDVADSLKKFGFQTTLVRNATLGQMREATRTFADQLPSADVALIYFAGHGIESNRKNYMIPVNADLKFEYELADQGYDAGIWLEMLENIKSNNADRVNIVILDACRNNSLIGSRNLGRGLGKMDAPSGTFLAYSTAPGKVAADGGRGERNSPFTKHLLRAMQQPNQPIEEVFKEVRRNVGKETNGAQVPWESTSLTGFFSFRQR
jgi:hypothetical protein